MSDRERSMRHGRILSLFDWSAGRGLEIGPLFDPVVHRFECDVRYVDVHAGPQLKEYYATHPGVPVDDIVDPDFVLIGPEGTRTLVEAVEPAAPFDWIVASHVIEHVPNLIGWLSEVSEILTENGQLVLAVPDRRFSFDADRPPTTVGEMLLAERQGDKIPSVRAIYDHYSRVVTIDSADAWRGVRPGPGDRIHGRDYVREQLRLAVEDKVYVDCHVWLFTPQSFVDQLVELAALNLTDLVVKRVVPTAPGELEFYAVLQRVPGGRIGATTPGAELTGLDDRPTPPTDPTGDANPSPPALSAREWRLIRAKRSAVERIRRAWLRVKS
jgi:SAM-dependent methyltransferase